jgi:AraC family transcriptional activator of pobA
MKKNLPVYAIHDFKELTGEGIFYANNVKEHVAQHHFTNLPHKHDFFLVILFTKGSGTHEIDFESYTVKPGSLFILKPGQMHYWKLSADVDGFVFFHTKEFYDEGFTKERVMNYSFLKSFRYRPFFLLKDKNMQCLKELMHSINEEYQGIAIMRFQKIHALINLCYVELERLAGPQIKVKNEIYQKRLQLFEDLLDKNYKTEKSAKKYAEMLNVTEKHLNRIVRTCLYKTTTQLISERVILEAKRLLVQAKYSVEQIGAELGYIDKSYFTRFFKKNTGMTPSAFLSHYKKGP